MQPTIETRLARLEVRIDEREKRAEERHKELKALIEPAVAKLADHHVDIVVLKRDRHWTNRVVYGIAAVVGGIAGLASRLWPHSS